MWNLRNKRNDQRERGGGETEGGRERELMKQTLNYREQTEGYQREGGLGGERVKQVMGIKEGSCPDEHQVIYEIVQSLHWLPETHVTLYVNQLELK